MAVAGRREGELGVRRGDTVAVGLSGAGTAGCAVEGAQSRGLNSPCWTSMGPSVAIAHWIRAR